MRRIGNNSVSECPCEIALRYIGGAWKVLIVWHLIYGGTHRHAELKRRLSGITAKILTQQLREMEQDGLVQRQVFPEVPPRVEYRLTPRGETLRPVIDAMYAWGKEHGRDGKYEALSKICPPRNVSRRPPASSSEPNLKVRSARV